MSFYGSSFLFDGIASEQYSLRISDLDISAINEAMGSFDVEIKEQKILRRTVPYFYGAYATPHLEFDMSCYSEDELTAADYQLIQKWLFGQSLYKKLQIVQYDMQDIFWWAILNSPQTVKVGNRIMGCKFHVIANSPFGFSFPKTVTYSYTSSVVNNNEVFYNSSDDTANYMYPSCVITMNNIGGDVTITNSNDSSRVFEFTDLQADEVITIDNSFQTISSSSGLRRLGNFNKHWLRFVPGINNLNIQGNVLSIAITFSNIVKKIGG